jgi:hypothetical protein
MLCEYIVAAMVIGFVAVGLGLFVVYYMSLDFPD